MAKPRLATPHITKGEIFREPNFHSTRYVAPHTDNRRNNREKPQRALRIGHTKRNPSALKLSRAHVARRSPADRDRVRG